MTRRYRITYYLGQFLYTYLRDAIDEQTACVDVPQAAEHLTVREII